MRNPDPGQHEISAVVSDEPDIASSRFPAPSNKPIARPQVPRRRRPCQTCHRPLSGKDHELELFADRLDVMKVVMLFDERIEQRLFRRPPHQPKLQRTEILQAELDRCGIYLESLRLGQHRHRVWWPPFYRRQCDLAPPF